MQNFKRSSNFSWRAVVLDLVVYIAAKLPHFLVFHRLCWEEECIYAPVSRSFLRHLHEMYHIVNVRYIFTMASKCKYCEELLPVSD